MDGDRSILALNAGHAALADVLHDPLMNGGPVPDCAPPVPASEETLDEVPCSAGHTACYVSPYGDVYPCVQFPLSCGNVRRSKFLDIWRNSEQMKEVRSIRLRDLSSCSQCGHVSSCTRCPGLAFMEGNMRGPSTQDCEKSFARTGIPSVNLSKRKPDLAGLVQIAGLRTARAALNA
jgi:radical SAM protein with 4Fe4S-binding SPASM domain